MKFFSLLLLTTAIFPSICAAELRDENLLQLLPKGYKVDFQSKQGNMLITEMVPQAETVNNWTEMVTTQVFLGMKDTTTQQFQNKMSKMWLAVCKNGEATPIRSGNENGYDFSLWLLTCPLNPSTGKPETTWFKAIKGNDSFYVVQKAFKFAPTKEQVTHWMRYLRSVKVCDTRLPNRSC